MKYKNRNTYFLVKSYKILLIVTIISMIGCKKFLEIPPPKNELVSSSTFSNSMTANAVALGIYSKMVNYLGFPYKISKLTGLAGDELQNYSTAVDVATFYTNNVSPKNSYISSDFWNEAYNYIYNANSMLEGVSSSNLSVQLKGQLKGEAKFIRAFWHFYLVNLYGDIPLVTSTDYSVNGFLSRTLTSDIYKQIISDLKDAQDLLNVNYVAADGITTTTVERVRPNKSVATALLARAYLYTNDFVNAEIEAAKVIDQSAYSLVADLSKVFLKNSNETIWALQPAPSGSFSTPEASNYILTTVPSTGANKDVTISTNLLSAFENNDTRKTKWISNYTSYSFPFKYKVFSGTSLTEYSVVLRLAEQHLIRAEARAQQNKISEGLQDVNKIRNRAGLSDTTTTSKDQLLDIIIHERQVELFAEYGHRWFDFKRTGKIDAVMPTVAIQKGGTWSPYKKLFPIPQQSLDSNPNLIQNLGYN